MSRVSVIIPNYNRAGFIQETLANLLAQSQPPCEIIVVDDGSTDGSVEVIRSFGHSITLLQQKNEGPGAARNAGLRIAKGDYIQFQDSDDLYSLNKLEAQSDILDQTGADIALGPWAHVFLEDGRVQFETCVLQQGLPPAQQSLRVLLFRGWFTIFQSLMFRRDFLTKCGEYRTDLRYTEDTEFLCRILGRSPRLAFTGNTLTLYRVNAPNKLSHDGGRAKSQRDWDFAKCMHCMLVESEIHPQKLDQITKIQFRSRIRKHMRYLGPDLQPFAEVIAALRKEVGQTPAALLELIELSQRLAERIRLARNGCRWMPALQAGPATEQQRKLIFELGFKEISKGK